MSASIDCTKEQFWSSVCSTTSSYNPDAPVNMMGRLVANKSEDMRNQMFASCTKTDDFVLPFFEKERAPGKVLDLGAGQGANSLGLSVNSKVTAIDSDKDLLLAYSKNSRNFRCPAENIRLIKADITKLPSLGENFDMVIAVDILPYIPSIHLQSTMEKIHSSMVDNGTLIGSIFTIENQNPMTQIFMDQLGAYFYRGGERFVEDLLTHSGFRPEIIQAREESGYSFKAVKVPN